MTALSEMPIDNYFHQAGYVSASVSMYVSWATQVVDVDELGENVWTGGG